MPGFELRNFGRGDIAPITGDLHPAVANIDTSSYARADSGTEPRADSGTEPRGGGNALVL